MPNVNLSWAGNIDILHPSAERSADGVTEATEGWGPVRTIRAQLVCTALAGADFPSLVVRLEDTLDGGDTWNTIGTFTELTAPGRDVINVTTPFGPDLRLSWDLEGTATFEVRALGES